MRVLHVIPTIALEHGGPSQAVRSMARAAATRGVHVEVVATSFGTPQARDDPGRVWEYEEDRVLYRLFPQVRGSRWNLSMSLTRWLFANAKRWDMLHVHAPFSYPTLPACAAAQHSNVPYVYRTLGMLDPWCLRQEYWKKWPYYHLLVRRSLHHAAAVHVTSDMERQTLVRLGYGARTVIVPIAVSPSPPAPRDQHSGPTRLLFLGRLHPKKGLPVLLRALALALVQDGRRFVLEVAGDGEPRYRRELEVEARRLGVIDAVRFLGFVTGESKTRAFADADMFVLSSFHENFGVAVVEALAAGLPAILSDGVALAQEVHKAGAGLSVPTGDVSALADAIRELSAPERMKEARPAARSFARRFSPEVVTDELMRLYEAVTQGYVLQA